jgi:hypothetical protein
MPKLSDTQAILLVHAAQHKDESLHPLPKSLLEDGNRTEQSIAGLLKRGLIEERETHETSMTHRTEGDARFGLFITSSGLAALNISPDAGTGEPNPSSVCAPPPERQTKSALVKSLLQRPNGATLSELIEATSWLPHTTRAALTGLRKKGLVIERFSRDGTTCYRSLAAA